MRQISPMEIAIIRHVRGCIEAYLQGKKSLNWVKGVIQNSGILELDETLKVIFSGLRMFEKSPRYREVERELKKEGWL